MLNTSNIHKKTYKNDNNNDNDRSNVRTCKVCETRRDDDNNDET